MIQLPKYIFDEMLSISKALSQYKNPDSIKHSNAVRKASKLYNKLNTIKVKTNK